MAGTKSKRSEVAGEEGLLRLNRIEGDVDGQMRLTTTRMGKGIIYNDHLEKSNRPHHHKELHRNSAGTWKLFVSISSNTRWGKYG